MATPLSIEEFELWGWDDGSVLFAHRPLGREYRVTDDPELNRRLKELCLEYLRERGLLDPTTGQIRDGRADAS